MNDQNSVRRSTVSPYLAVSDGHAQVEFLKAAFDARVVEEAMEIPGSRFGHCEVLVGNSIVMIGEPPDGKTYPGMIYVDVADCDASYQRLLDAGATPVMPPKDMGDGCRRGGAEDMNGNRWWIGSDAGGEIA